MGRPIFNDCLYFAQYFFRARDTEAISDGEQIRPAYVVKFSVHAHQVLARPFAFGIMGVRHVIGRGQFPLTTLLEEKRKVLGSRDTPAGDWRGLPSGDTHLLLSAIGHR